MPKTTKLFFLGLISLLFCFLTYRFCYFLAETYFFDKFFYQKSITHGYIPYQKDIPLSTFGKRSRFLSILDTNDNILGIQTENKFTILIIGDSYTWGVGLKNNQRFAYLLEQQLNKIHPTEIISLAKPGWNLIEFHEAYTKTIQHIQPNLTIFSLVYNDAYLSESNTNNPDYTQCQSKFPNIKVTFNLDTCKMISENTPLDKVGEIQNQIHKDSWSNPINLCVLDNNLNDLPTKNTIYFITDDYENNNLYNLYKEHLIKWHKQIVNSNLAKNITKYKNVWTNPYTKLGISQKEGHPNALANRMYADILYKEITTNPEWGFIGQ